MEQKHHQTESELTRNEASSSILKKE
jgi:hypothetical protein